MSTQIVSISGLSVEDFNYKNFYRNYLFHTEVEKINCAICNTPNLKLTDGVNPVPVKVFTFTASI